jgi:integrase/recombinase XerD
VRVARCVEIYVGRKQACGYSYVSIARLLRRFVRFIRNIHISLVTDYHLNAFLSCGRASNNTWRHHASCLFGFFRYWFARRQIRQIPTPKQKPAEARTFFPYIYSREEIRRLVNVAAVSQQASRCTFGPKTLKTILLFLYGTAMKIDDALALSYSDVDFRNASIQVHSTSVHQKRVIPLGGDVMRLVRRYLKSDERRRFGPGGSLFLTAKGRAVQHSDLGAAFRRLRKIAGIKRVRSLYQPRIQDLRHTFAVHSIEQWTRDGHALHKMLPMLATYMGNVDMQGLERYLELSSCSYQAQLDRLKRLAATNGTT